MQHAIDFHVPAKKDFRENLCFQRKWWWSVFLIANPHHSWQTSLYQCGNRWAALLEFHDSHWAAFPCQGSLTSPLGSCGNTVSWWEQTQQAHRASLTCGSVREGLSSPFQDRNFEINQNIPQELCVHTDLTTETSFGIQIWLCVDRILSQANYSPNNFKSNCGLIKVCLTLTVAPQSGYLFTFIAVLHFFVHLCC